MALGALAANPSLDLKIVTCGLNYFHPHRFRSRAVVEFGEPLTVPPELVEMYKRGGAEKREACGKLLDTIYEALRGVTLNAPDYETLMVRPSSVSNQEYEVLCPRITNINVRLFSFTPA